MIHLYELYLEEDEVKRLDLGIIYLGEEKIIFIPHNPSHPIVKEIEKLNKKNILIERSAGKVKEGSLTKSTIKIDVPINRVTVNVLNENLDGDYLVEDLPLTKRREEEIKKDVFDDGKWFKLVFSGNKALVRANRAFGRLNLEEMGRFFPSRIGGFDSVTISSPAAILATEGVMMPNDASAILLVDNRIIINGKQRAKEKRGYRDIPVMSTLGAKIWRLLPPDLKIPFKKLRVDKELSEEDVFGYEFAIWYSSGNSTNEKGIGYAKAFRRLFWEILAGEKKGK